MKIKDTQSIDLPAWKKIIFYLFLVVLVGVVLEYSAILYLKAFEGYDGEHLIQYEFDPYKNILPTRNYVDTRGITHNSQGFRRSVDVPKEKQPGTIRIFLMGGSTAYGLGGLWPHIQTDYVVIDNTETIDAYLEKLLSKRFSGYKIEVINAAITSTWTHHHLIYINQTILKYNPDMVVFIDGFNDFYHTAGNHDQFAAYAHKEHSHVIMSDPTLYTLAYTNMFWLYRKSAFMHILFTVLKETKQALHPRAEQLPIDVTNKVDALRKIFPDNALQMAKRLALILRAEKIPAIFVLQPMLILERDRSENMPEIERKLFEFNVDWYSPNYEQFIQRAVNYVSKIERETIEPLGGVFIDATKLYDVQTEQIYTDYAHLTPKGNEILANHISKYVIPIVERNFDETIIPVSD